MSRSSLFSREATKLRTHHRSHAAGIVSLPVLLAASRGATAWGDGV